ncbi:MAG: ABC transporter permease [Chloroflexi bacterium]|nr:MAG: ABC transporter permease [Chloroflexota bacterium]
MMKMLAASVRMVVRDKQSIFWALAFPIIFLCVFRLFSFETTATTNIVVSADTQTPPGAALVAALGRVAFMRVRVEPGLNEAQALEILNKRGGNRVDMALLLRPSTAPGQPATAELIDAINDPVGSAVATAAIGSIVDATNLQLTGVPRSITLTSRPAGVQRTTYFQFLGPGIIGMGLMTFATISLAGSLSRYREEGVLRRIRATPLPPWRFFSSVLGAHVIVSLMQVLVLATVAQALGANVFAGGIWFIVIAVYGTVIFLNIGVIIAGRVHGRGAVEGAANAVTMPMMFLSGSFFPITSLPAAVRPFVEVLPLTHMLNAMRGIALDHESIAEQWPALLVMTAWVIGTLILARLSFSFADA